MLDLRDQKTPLPQASPPLYSDIPVTVDPAATNNTMSEAEWSAKLKKLEGKIRKYNWTKRGDEAELIESMRDLAAGHNDPRVRAYWTRRADQFEKAPDADKRAILMDIGRGLAILITAPFAIAGGLLVGTGMVLKASGDFLTKGLKATTK